MLKAVIKDPLPRQVETTNLIREKHTGDDSRGLRTSASQPTNQSLTSAYGRAQATAQGYCINYCDANRRRGLLVMGAQNARCDPRNEVFLRVSADFCSAIT